MDYTGKNDKVVFISTINDVHYDQRMQRIAKAFVEMGYTVHWFARSQFDKPFPTFFIRKPIKCIFSKGFLFYLEFTLRLFFKFLFSRPPVIYYAVDLDTILPNLFFSKVFGRKLVYDAHEFFSETPEVVNRPFVKKVWTTIGQLAAPKSDLCLTVGRSIASQLEKCYGGTFKVIRNVPIPHGATVEGGSSLLWYQGALNEGRGLEAIIHAMSYLPASICFEIAGDGYLRPRLEALVRELGLEQRVLFHGFIHPSDLPKLAQRASLGFNLLENKGLSYYHSLANRTFDYIQLGLPALHMDFPAYQALNKVYDVAWLVIELEPKQLANLIQTILNDQVGWQQKHINSLKAQNSLNWNIEQAYFKKLISELG